MSLLGIAFDVKGYVFRPFYLVLGVLYFFTLLSLLGTLYFTLFVKNTLENALNDIDKERKRYKRK
jgi:hypothetical protein